MKIPYAYLSVLLLLVIVFACSKPAKEELLKQGKISNGTYTNDYFGLSVKIPKDWTVQNQDQVDTMDSLSKERIKSANKSLEREVDLSQERIVYLLSMFEHQAGTSNNFNSSLIVMAEKIEGMNVNEEAYLQLSVKHLNQTGFYQTSELNIKPVKLAQQDFYRLTATAIQDPFLVKQEFFTRIMKGYAVLFIMSYTEDEQKRKLDEILSSLVLTGKVSSH